MGDEDCSMI